MRNGDLRNNLKSFSFSGFSRRSAEWRSWQEKNTLEQEKDPLVALGSTLNQPIDEFLLASYKKHVRALGL